MAQTETIEAFVPPLVRQTLLDVMPVVQLSDDDARMMLAGWQMKPEACAASNGGTLAIDCFGKTAAMSTHASGSTVDGIGFLVYARDDCSAFGFEAADYEGRARRLLASIASWHVAREMNAGTVTGGLSPANTPLASGATTVENAAPASPENALACLEDGLLDATKNRRGFIYVRPNMLTHLAANQLIHLEGNTWLTASGNFVVSDAGFTGQDPDGTPLGTNQFIYASSWTEIRKSGVVVFGGPGAEMDRSVNTITTWAVQAFTWIWDGCYIGAAEVNLGIC